MIVLVEIILLKLLPGGLKVIDDVAIEQDITKDLNSIMLHLIDNADLSTCFYAFLDLSRKYD
jgi:hypothetical protein